MSQASYEAVRDAAAIILTRVRNDEEGEDVLLTPHAEDPTELVFAITSLAAIFVGKLSKHERTTPEDYLQKILNQLNGEIDQES